MASLTPNTITLKGDPQGREGLATVAVKPGHLLALGARTAAAVAAQDSHILSCKPHDVAAGIASAAFAREPDIFGGSIDSTYAIGDTVLYSEFRKGDMVYAWLATGNSVTAGVTFLESAGDGTLRITTKAVTSATTAAATPVARAMETINNASGSPQRIKVEVL